MKPLATPTPQSWSGQPQAVPQLTQAQKVTDVAHHIFHLGQLRVKGGEGLVSTTLSRVQAAVQQLSSRRDTECRDKQLPLQHRAQQL